MCKHREKWPCLRAAALRAPPALGREEISRGDCMCVGMYVESGRMLAVRRNTPLGDGASGCVYYCVFILSKSVLVCVNGTSAVSQ